MAKNYVYAYEGIKKQATELGTELPEHINPNGVALLDYLKGLKEQKLALEGKVEKTMEEKMSKMLIDKAIPDAENFYTDVVGNAPDYGDG